MVKNPPASAGDVGLIPGWGRSPGGGHGNPLQYSCLENPTDRGAWCATVHGVAKSQTWLSDWTTITNLREVTDCHNFSICKAGMQNGACPVEPHCRWHEIIHGKHSESCLTCSQLIQFPFRWLSVKLKWLCDLGQVAYIFHAAVSSSVNEGTIIPCVMRVVLKIIIENYKNLGKCLGRWLAL